MTVEERKDIPGTYLVVSGGEVYNCDLRNEWESSCDCPDFLYRDRVCKHLQVAMDFRDGVE